MMQQRVCYGRNNLGFLDVCECDHRAFLPLFNSGGGVAHCYRPVLSIAKALHHPSTEFPLEHEGQDLPLFSKEEPRVPSARRD